MTIICKYVSDRNKPLLHQETYDKPVLTAENYEKWYDLFVIFPNGDVESLSDLGITTFDVAVDGVGTPRIDHNYHPLLLEQLAKDNNWYLDISTLEMAAGRWAIEYDNILKDENRERRY